MLTGRSRAVIGLSLALVAGLLALPACGKKKHTEPDKPAPGPGDPSTPKSGSPVDASLPPPPTAGPHLLATDARSRQKSQNNLKQIGLALHNLHSTYNAFPLGIADSSGKVGLSWRVAILPYLEQDNLYKQFKLNEPWNSEHNKKLIAQMPKLYAPPGTDTNGYTYYRSFGGKGAFMPPATMPGLPGRVVPGLRMSSITDGMSNTLAVAEAAEPVIWTKPDDLPFTPGKPPKLGGQVFDNGSNVLISDGSVRFLSSNADPRIVSNLIQTNDGNPVQFPD